MSFTDYYKVLELEKGASDEDIKKAFRRLARQYHPDANPNNPDAEERFKKISEAYEVLSNPQKRAKYDSVDSQYRAYTNSGQGKTWQDFGRSNSFTFDSEDYSNAFNGTSFGDLLSQMFGAGAQRGSSRRTSARASQPKRMFQVSLTVEEAYNGVTKRFTIDDKKVDVTFKPGVENKQRLRIPEGELEVAIAAHPRYTLDGRNLRVTEQIRYSTAVLGGTVTVKTPGGQVSMAIPPHTQAGKTFRLKGQGMPKHGKPSEKADLLVTVQVAVPSQLSNEQRSLIEQLQESGL